MLDFFRRHQRYFFIIITIVIVISFSFFGTYNSLSDSPFREQVAFKAIDGSTITRHELDEMATFIATDSNDKLFFGGMWGPNFLNDGVITKSFLETGLGAILAMSYAEDIQPDLVARLEKEKRYSLYAHPQAKFIGIEAAWNYFAPQMTASYGAMRHAQDPTNPEAFQARTALFLAEKKFPQQILRQILRYQEKQYSWIAPDKNLERVDLSLFGYHTIEDWFGPRFTRLTSEFIINAAKMAEQKGYQVTKSDALADLIRNAEISFQQNASSPHLGVATSHEYFNEQLRRLGMDQNGAANVWRQIMLFRVFFQDMGNSVFVDSYTFKHFDTYALDSVEGELYRLPKELQLKDFKSLQKFETYLDAISQRSEQDKISLVLPSTFLTAAQVSQKNPELVQKRYQLEIKHFNQKNLEGNVGVKESWNWQVADSGWEKLKKQFPELNTKNSSNREERFVVLEGLDVPTRGRIDAYTRAEIVSEHPEWLAKALEEAEAKVMMIGLHEKGKNSNFIGLEDGKSLIQLLDAAPLASEIVDQKNPAFNESAAKLALYSADHVNYYQINVIERAKQPEILTFAQAEKEGVLNGLLDKQLEAAYPKIREKDPKSFQKEDKSWKNYSEVKEQVAERFFTKILDGIKSNYETAISPEKAPEKMIPDFAATLRFYPYLQATKLKLLKDPTKASLLTKDVGTQSETIAEIFGLNDQWKLERSSYQTSRSNAENALDQLNVFKLSEGEWTKVNTPANGDLSFFHLTRKSNSMNEKALLESVTQTRKLLSNDAQQKLMYHVLETIKEKNGISFEYLKQVAEINEMNDEEINGN